MHQAVRTRTYTRSPSKCRSQERLGAKAFFLADAVLLQPVHEHMVVCRTKRTKLAQRAIVRRTP